MWAHVTEYVRTEGRHLSIGSVTHAFRAQTSAPVACAVSSKYQTQTCFWVYYIFFRPCGMLVIFFFPKASNLEQKIKYAILFHPMG